MGIKQLIQASSSLHGDLRTHDGKANQRISQIIFHKKTLYRVRWRWSGLVDHGLVGFFSRS